MSIKHPANEAERNATVDRDQTRRFILGQAQVIVDAVLNTPADEPVKLWELLTKFRKDVLEVAVSFRKRNHERHAGL
jgi:hypothetical protein